MSERDRHGPSRKHLVGLPIAVVILGGVYIFGLHPASGAAGGIVFLLIGWAVPSLLPVLLALWAALLCRSGRLVRLGIFAVVVVLASVNTRLPALVGQVWAATNSEWQVERQVERSDRYDFVMAGNPLALAQPALPRVAWHGSERCMCLYLGRNIDMSYKAGLDGYLGKSVLMETDSGHGLHLAAEIIPNPDGRSGTVTVQFRDQQGVAATFRQHGIPLIPATQGLGGDGLQGADVATHGMDLLLHDNMGLKLLSAWLPSYFDRQGFAAFMAAATVSAKSPESMAPGQ